MKTKIKAAVTALLLPVITLALLGYAAKPAAGFAIPVPAAPGAAAHKNGKAVIDYSNAKDGYVMVRYAQRTSKPLRVLIKGPSGVSYTYTLKSNGDYEVFPFSDGNGGYTVGVYEQVQGTKYAVANSATVKVALTDEFSPFIRPNQYVNYDKDKQTVRKAAELAGGSAGLIDKISAIYNYVVNNLTYDKELAMTVQSGYIPNVDAVLAKGKGICFDYSAVMAAMLRSLGIPCKMAVGYAGNVYHAWINAYSRETGWINQVIYFDGSSWKLMDPTFASSAKQSSEIMKYIGNGSNYKTKFIY